MERSFKNHTQLYFCKWEEICGIYNYDELRELFDQSGQLYEFEKYNTVEVVPNSWNIIGYDQEDKQYGFIKYVDQLIDVLRFFQDNENFESLVAICDNMTIRRVN